MLADQHLHLHALLDLAEILSQQNNFKEILRVVAQKAAAVPGAETVSILLLNPQTQHTVKTIFRDGRVVEDKSYQLVQWNVCGWVLRYKRPFLSGDIHADDRFEKSMFKNTPVKSALAVPLMVEGFVFGCLVLMNQAKGNEFTHVHLDLLQKLAAISAPHLRNVQELKQYFETPLPKNALIAKFQSMGMIGKSGAFLELLQSIEAAAGCDVRVLLEGRTGTGKELVARAIHDLSNRNGRPFVAVDCGAIPQNLIESELFGYVKGAFTGAKRDRKGLIAEADGGTLFLDEIASLPLDMQSKLIRVLQEGEVRPLGGNKTLSVNTRVISAASRSLLEMVREKTFREDLYYRLLVYPISVPSLAERRPDIPLIANHFLSAFSKQHHKSVKTFHGAILEYMKQRAWEGNIRELQNFVERLVAFAPPDAKSLTHSLLPKEIRKEVENFMEAAKSGKNSPPLLESLRNYESSLLRQALEDNDWNQSRTARSLDIPEQTLRFKMKKLGIRRPE